MRRQYLVHAVSPFLQVVLVDGIPLSSCTVYLCGIFIDDISTREQFAFLVYCYRVKAAFHNLCTVLYWRLCSLTNSPIVKYPLNWGWCALSAEGSLKQWLPNGKLLLLSLTKCHGVPCSLPSRITTKAWKTARLFLQDRDQDQDQDQMFKTKIKTNTFIFVLEAPRDQDPGLEDYITGSGPPSRRWLKRQTDGWNCYYRLLTLTLTQITTRTFAMAGRQGCRGATAASSHTRGEAVPDWRWIKKTVGRRPTCCQTRRYSDVPLGRASRTVSDQGQLSELYDDPYPVPRPPPTHTDLLPLGRRPRLSQ